MKLSLTHAAVFGATFLLGVTAGAVTVGRIVSSSSQWQYAGANAQTSVVSSSNVSAVDPRRDGAIGVIKEVEFKIKTAVGVSHATAVVYCDTIGAQRNWDSWTKDKAWAPDVKTALRVAVCPNH